MHTALAWVASTPQGAALGERAAREIHIENTGTPWWSAPLEPVRWFDALAGSFPHTFYTLGMFALMSVAFGAWWRRRGYGWRASAAAALAMLLTLGGMSTSQSVFDTWLSGGIAWRVPQGAPYRLADLHAHTQASGGALMPEDVVDWHLARGFSVLAITDSNGVRGAARAQAHIDAAGLPMVLVPGEEYRGTTHLLMLGVTTPVLPAERSVPDAIADARAQGALVLVAHPWTSDRTPVELVAAGAQGFEITNGGVLADEATRALARQRGLAVVGDLDFRGGQHPLTATVLPAWADTPARVAQALARGECAALYFQDEVDVGAFSYPAQLRRKLTVLVEERTGRLAAGLAFWAAVLLLARGRLRLPRRVFTEGRALFVVSACAAVTGIFAVCCMWWQFRRGWIPRSEWACYVWALAVPIAWAALLGVPHAAQEGPGLAPNRAER